MILNAGRNCSSIDKNTRFKLLVDGKNYFESLEKALPKAKETIYIHAWEINGQFNLHRKGKHQKKLKDFLEQLVKHNPKLNIYIICWDFSIFFTLEREFFQKFRFQHLGHDRIHFCFNKNVPLGGSVHQKYIVIDDEILFIGGLDVTQRRYDDREHKIDSELRVDPSGKKYGPFHDIQVMVQGNSANVVGESFRREWPTITNQKAKQPQSKIQWPDSITPDLKGNLIGGLSRTLWNENPKKRLNENYQLYLDTIESAQTYMYFESQYLSSVSFVDALIKKLEKNLDLVEIVLVVSVDWSGLFEKMVLGSIAQYNLKRLLMADKYNCLRIVTPYIREGKSEKFVKIHSKICIVDDELIRVGSTNLSERSFFLDSELDFTLISSDNKEKIHFFLADLFAEHLGIEIDEAITLLSHKGPCGLIDSTQGNNRCLRIIEDFSPKHSNFFAPFHFIADAKDPLKSVFKKNLIFFGKILTDKKILSLMVGVCILMWFTSQQEFLEPLRSFIEKEIHDSQKHGKIYNLGIIVFTLATLIGVPLNALIPLIALTLPGLDAFVICMTGALISSSLGYYLGRVFGVHFIPDFAKEKVEKSSQFLQKKGVLTIFLTRSLPIAPFIIINMVSGAVKISFPVYLQGTFLGLLPGMAAFIFLGSQLKMMQIDFSWVGIITFLTIFSLFILLMIYLKSYLTFQKRMNDVA